jgi:Domain of unknown function (DUF5069)
MEEAGLRTPSAKVGGIVYFGRMLGKIRAHARDELPSDYQPNLGKGFDASCVKFLRVEYDQLVQRVKQGGTDDEILEWCFANGHRPSEDEIFVWNEFMRKSGWSDRITSTLERRKKEAGMGERDDIQTMFDFIDADEGRPVAARS